VKALQMTGWQRDPELRDVGDPTPGPGEVLVRVGGAGACHSDLHLLYEFAEGLSPFELPFTIGHENAGWVEAVGAGVEGIEPGLPVAVYGPWGCGVCSRCRAGVENLCENAATLGKVGCGLGWDGGMAEYVKVRSPRHLVPIGDLDPVDAAPLTDAALTPYRAVKRSLDVLTPGSTAVVVGAGGLGHMAIQILDAISPARVIAIDTDADARRLAEEVGASVALDSNLEAVLAVRELTGGQGADLVLDCVGTDDTMRIALACTRSMGHLTLVGLGGGSLPVGFFTAPFEARVASSYWGSIGELAEVIALAQAGKIRAHVERFPLADAQRAYDGMRDGTLRGRAVIVP
jgi:propanol-preferring alcohol dehydrogenase